MVGYRGLSARYQYGSSTECKAKAGRLAVGFFFAFEGTTWLSSTLDALWFSARELRDK